MTSPTPLGGYVMPSYRHALAVLVQAFEAEGIPQRDLCERLGWAPASVHDALRGVHEVRSGRLFELAQALGYDLALVPREDA